MAEKPTVSLKKAPYDPHKPPDLDLNEIRRRLRDLGKQLGVDSPENDIPGGSTELWPGGPSEDTGDIFLAGRIPLRRRNEGVA